MEGGTGDGGGTRGEQGTQPGSDAYSFTWPTLAIISGHQTTGSQTLAFTLEASTASRPFQYLNPDGASSGFDSRNGDSASVFTCWEVDL